MFENTIENTGFGQARRKFMSMVEHYRAKTSVDAMFADWFVCCFPFDAKN